MNAIVSKMLLVFLLMLSGCSRTQDARPGDGISSPKSQVASKESIKSQDSNLQHQVYEIAMESKGRVGASAVMLETGETVASLNPQDHFPMQSVYKLPI